MQKRLIIGTLFSFLLIMVFQGCNKSPIPTSETPPWLNAVQVEPNVTYSGKYVTIFGSYIQLQVIPADSDRIDTSFSYLWKDIAGSSGYILDTLNDTIFPDTKVKSNVVRWYPDTSVYGGIYVQIFDSRNGLYDTVIPTRVLPYKYEGEIVDSSFQLPTGFGISSDRIAILDAKNMTVNFYSKSNLTETGTLILPNNIMDTTITVFSPDSADTTIDTTAIENPIDIVFDEYDRMYISSAFALVRFVKNGDSYNYDTLVSTENVNNGSYLYYKNERLYLTSNYGYNLFSIYDTTLNCILDVSPKTIAGAVRGGITVNNNYDIYVLYTDVDGIPYLRKYDQGGHLVVDNLLPLDSLPDSTYFNSTFYMASKLYICGSSPNWDGVQLVDRSEPKLGWKWGTGGSNGPDRFRSIVDADARGDTFYLLDAGNKALKIFTYIH